MASARRRPWRGGRRRRRWLGRHPAWRPLRGRHSLDGRGSLGLGSRGPLGLGSRGSLRGRSGGRRRGGPPAGCGRRRRRGREQFHEDRIRHQPRTPGLAGVVVHRLVGGHGANWHGLRLVTRQGEAHGELVAGHSNRARGAAGLAKRGPCLGAGRLGLELHGGRGRRHGRWTELHPTWHGGTRCQAEPAGGDCKDACHCSHFDPLGRRSVGHVTPRQPAGWGAAAHPRALRPTAAGIGATGNAIRLNYGKPKLNDSRTARVREIPP
jgi:hypothetical protein